MGTGYISQPNNQNPNPNLNNALQTINTALQTITSRPQITAPPIEPPALPLPPPPPPTPPITITNTPGPTGFVSMDQLNEIIRNQQQFYLDNQQQMIDNLPVFQTTRARRLPTGRGPGRPRNPVQFMQQQPPPQQQPEVV